MILVDTGALFALFDPAEPAHQRCRDTLESIDTALGTTLPALSDALHLLSQTSHLAPRLMDFVSRGGLIVWPVEEGMLERAFDLMRQLGEPDMDLADASLLAVAEAHAWDTVFTIDRQRYAGYRLELGPNQPRLKLIG